jgi:hypothetical protein
MTEVLYDTPVHEETPTAPSDVLRQQAPIFLAVRNARYTPSGSVDCEVQHSVYGWIPFHATATDSEAHGRELFAALMHGEYGTIADCRVKTVAEIKAAIAAERYNHEVSGIVFNGLDINTERASQGLILGAALEAFMDPDYQLNWKTPTGFVALTSPVILAVAKAIRAHVQACFNREGELVAAVDAGTYNESMLHLGWPTGE